MERQVTGEEATEIDHHQMMCLNFFFPSTKGSRVIDAFGLEIISITEIGCAVSAESFQ